MFADRIRGAAGVVFAVLALLLWRGAGYAEGAPGRGCPDDANCYSETKEEGVVGPQGQFITNHTATCQGDCVPGQDCEPISIQNPDGTSTFQCSCNSDASPKGCSGFATVDSNGQVQSYSCQGDCGSTSTCRKRSHNVQTDRNCPTGYSLNRSCECE